MNAITVTREYGAGGYEVAGRLAALLGWELLDRELLHRAAAVEHLPDSELERLDEKAVSLADRFSLHPPHQRYLHGLREAARQAAARGNVVLVGRGTGQLLADFPEVLHLRLAAPLEWRARRMAGQQGWGMDQALARCAEEDRNRNRFTRYFFGDEPFQPAAYHAVFNTARVPLEDVATCIAAVVRGEEAPGGASASGVQQSPASPGRRVLTLSRELGAGERSFAATVGPRLGLKVHDRDLLEQEAARLGVSAAELEQVDEQPAGIFQRFRPGSLYQRYFDALGQLLRELAEGGDVLLVGRGGSGFLRDHPRAYHVRIVAPSAVRVRRVMEHRWVREAAARGLIADSDSQRRRFYESYFTANWADPLEYHLTVNTGRLGPSAVDLTALAASRHWGRTGEATEPRPAGKGL
jgi:cytidylate kinase